MSSDSNYNALVFGQIILIKYNIFFTLNDTNLEFRQQFSFIEQKLDQTPD